MSNKICHLWPQEPKREGDTLKLSFVIEPPHEDKFEIWYRVPLEMESWVSERADAFTLGGIYYMMTRGLDAKIHGTVTTSLLDNLHHYMEIWKAWEPNFHHVVSLEADNEASLPEATGDKTLGLFSGGLDAAFTIQRHAFKTAGRATRNLTHCMIVFGFNIQFHESEFFDAVYKRAKETIDDINLPLIRMESNWMQQAYSTINNTNASGLASFLTLFQKHFRHGIFANSVTHDYRWHWGSHPLCDAFVRSDAFEVISDDGACCRLDKPVPLQKWPVALKNLQVCNKHNDGYNCGQCEKCIRTALCFVANNVPVPESLPVNLTPKAMDAIAFHDEYRIDIVGRILKRAKQNGVDTDYFRYLQKRYQKKMLRVSIRKYLEARKHTSTVNSSFWTTLNKSPKFQKMVNKVMG